MYHLYIAFWGVKNATYHLLGEPETTTDYILSIESCLFKRDPYNGSLQSPT